MKINDLEECIKLLYSLLGKSPMETYVCVFNLRNIPIRKKLSLVAACFNDQKTIDLENNDPLDRNRVIKSITKSIEKLVATLRIKEMENAGLL